MAVAGDDKSAAGHNKIIQCCTFSEDCKHQEGKYKTLFCKMSSFDCWELKHSWLCAAGRSWTNPLCIAANVVHYGASTLLCERAYCKPCTVQTQCSTNLKNLQCKPSTVDNVLWVPSVERGGNTLSFRPNLSQTNCLPCFSIFYMLFFSSSHHHHHHHLFHWLSLAPWWPL